LERKLSSPYLFSSTGSCGQREKRNKKERYCTQNEIFYLSLPLGERLRVRAFSVLSH
jgi:hypothetical protein